MRRHASGLVAAFAALFLIAGCSSTRHDQSITTEIQAKLFSNPQVKNSNLDVSTKDGVVTLTGEVPDEGARYEAYKVASEISGVKKVNDQMTVPQTQTENAPATEATPAAPEKPAHAPSAHRTRTAENHRAPSHKRTDRASRKAVTTEAAAAETAAPLPEAPESAPAQPPAVPDTKPAAATPLPPPPEPQLRTVEIPAGTSLRIQMIDSVDSSVNHVGDTFHASLAAPIVVGNQVVVPKGTDIYVRLVNARSAGRIAGRSELDLELDRMEYQGQVYPLVSNEYQQMGRSRGKNTAEKVGAGAAIGAVLGAIIGHGKGAAIGATVGAGAGTAAQAATHGEQVRIPSETKLDFSLEQPVSVNYSPAQNNPIP